MNNEVIADAVNTPLDYNEPIFILLYSLSAVIQLFIAFMLFRIKRFKNGFPFIFKKFTFVASMIFTGIILLFVTWTNRLTSTEDYDAGYYLFILGVLIAGAGIFILIRRLVKEYQKMIVWQHSESQWQQKYFQEKDDHEHTKQKLDETLKAHSSVYHSMEYKLKAFQEAFDKGSATQQDLDDLEKSWQHEMDKLKMKKRLISTRVSSLDNLFDFFEGQFLKDNIDFNLILNGDIKYLVNNVIEQPHFETLITNHLTDARIAVNASSNTYRRITAVIGFDEFYEFTVFDSGIPFEVDTLVKLGTERVTTHAETGGSGIGFETTFEILREYNASLKIIEFEESDTSFSKSVSIRFDGILQYLIASIYLQP